MTILTLDIVAFIISTAGLVALLWNWKYFSKCNLALLFLFLLSFTLFYNFCLIIEWGGITKVLDPYENMAGAIIPMTWAFIFYALIINNKNTRLEESHGNLKRTLHSIGDGVIVTDPKTEIKIINPVAQNLTGWNSEECLGKELQEVFKIVNTNTGERVQNPVKEVLQNGQTVGLANHTTLISKTGEEHAIADSAAPVKNANNTLIGVVLVFRDITEKYKMNQKIRKKTKNLQEYKNRLEATMKLGNLAWWEYKLDEDNFLFNDQWPKMLGYNPDKFEKYADFEKLIHPDDHERVKTAKNNLEKHGEMYRIDYRIKTNDGNYKWIYDIGNVTARNSRNAPIKTNGVVVDITDNKRVEERIRSELQQKQTLLKELSHRTKNNMQQISSMLSLKATRSKNTAVQKALDEIKERIYSMSLVHKMLYDSQNLSRLNLGKYINRLVSHFRRAYSKNIQFKVSINTSKIEVLIDTAIPLGLIINELISNSIQHGFEKQDKGEISIGLTSSEEGIIVDISDNGQGLPNNLDFDQYSGMGLKIVKGLVKDQLEGEIYFEKSQGMKYRIIFTQKQYKARV